MTLQTLLTWWFLKVQLSANFVGQYSRRERQLPGTQQQLPDSCVSGSQTLLCSTLSAALSADACLTEL